MKIPVDDTGRMMLSVSQLRTYGAGGHLTDDQEEDQGCPRLYRAKYVDRVAKTEDSYPLIYGSLFHSILEVIEVEGLDPTRALQKCIGPEHTLEMLDEAQRDLDLYFSRPSSPEDNLAVIGVEKHLEALLYVDEEHGQVWLRGIIDVIAVEPDDPSMVHVRDYKTNRSPLSTGSIEGDVQMRGYHWLATRNTETLNLVDRPRIVSHLDLVKFRDYAYAYSDRQIENWETWAVAVARTILRDEDATPALNARCPDCPVKDTCPAYLAAPQEAVKHIARLTANAPLPTRLAWRKDANALRLLLEKAVKAFDDEFEAAVKEQGEIKAAGYIYRWVQKMATVPDVYAIADLLGDDFLRVATTSKAAIERADLPESLKAQVLARFVTQVTGMTVAKEAVGE